MLCGCFLVMEEDDMVKVPLRSHERPLSFLGGHFQDAGEKLTFRKSWIINL